MPNCEMCGRVGNLRVVDIEGADLKVCEACSKYGVVKSRVSVSPKYSSPTSLPKVPSVEFRVVDNYAFLLREAREKKALTQEDFAKFLQEKESVVAKWEQGQFKPGLDLAKRIGKVLGINLIEKDELSYLKENSKSKQGEPTLGDMVKIRKRRN